MKKTNTPPIINRIVFIGLFTIGVAAALDRGRSFF